MKQTILGQPPCRCKKQLKNKYRFCLMIGLLASLLNVYFTMARTEQNHNLMLALNIVIDIVSGSFLLWYISIHILPQRKMHKLFMREKTAIQGLVCSVENDTVRYMDMDCRRVLLDERVLFLPAGPLCLQPGKNYTLWVVSNIIVEAEQ